MPEDNRENLQENNQNNGENSFPPNQQNMYQDNNPSFTQGTPPQGAAQRGDIQQGDIPQYNYGVSSGPYPQANIPPVQQVGNIAEQNPMYGVHPHENVAQNLNMPQNVQGYGNQVPTHAQPQVPQHMPTQASPQYNLNQNVPPAGYQYQQPMHQVPPSAAQQNIPQAGYYYPVQPKKPMNTGLKVFIWIISVLAIGTILGFGVFLVYTATSEDASFSEEFVLPDGDYINPYDDFGDDDNDPFEEIVPPISEDEEREEIEIPENPEGIVINGRPDTDELTADEIYKKVANSTVTVLCTITNSITGEESTGTGTGIVATSDGYIITNSHVVNNSKSSRVKVIALDGEEYDAVVVGVDKTTDLAVLKMNDHGLEPAEFGSAEELSIGEWVIAIGNPGGAKFSSSLTRGVISGLNRTVGQYSENGMTYIQTDAAINPGNSGGPLLNMHGQVVGINSSKIITSGYEGMGFAIPVSKAANIINELISGGYVKGRVRLGIVGSDVTEIQAMMSGVPMGFQIMSIDEGSAFAGTDVRENDIIVAVDGEKVESLSEISNLLLKYKPGDEITVTVYRYKEVSKEDKGEEIDVKITLLEDKGETQK